MRGKFSRSALADLRARVALACRVLGILELTKGGQGHVSARIPGRDSMLIRARGPKESGVRYTTEKNVIEIDFDGKVVSSRAGLASPLEVFIHTEIYKTRPDIHSVIHIHPPTVVLFTICDKPLLPLFGAYDPHSMKLAIDGVPVYDRSILISTPALGRDLVAKMRGSCVCAMRGHGITTAANSIEEAAIHAINLNELATMNYQARLLGGARPISDEDQQDLLGRIRPAPSTPGEPGATASSMWRYFRALTDAD